MKYFAYALIALAVIGIGYYWLDKIYFGDPMYNVSADYKDAEYTIEGKKVKLTDGVSEVKEASGASTVVTRYFGNEIKTDLNGDGREDVLFLLTQNSGGSGTFYYAVAALNTEDGYVGSQAILLGDRIAPQSANLSQDPNQKGVVVVNYADRKAGEPMTAEPSVGKSIWLKLDPETMQFGEVAQNFEGEADPSRMTLTMQTWTWDSALYNDGRKISPHDPASFTLKFGSDGKFSATTDCNSMGGSYSASNGQISFSNIFSTKKYCANSQEQTFSELLRDSSGYHFTSRGQLILDLKFDSGSVVFK